MPTIEVSEETLEKIKEQLGELEIKEIEALEDFIGEKLFIRTVTYHALGRVKKIIGGKILELEEACFVADSGRFGDCLAKGMIDELEITGRHFVNFDAVTDFFIWKHDLPKETK